MADMARIQRSDNYSNFMLPTRFNKLREGLIDHHLHMSDRDVARATSTDSRGQGCCLRRGKMVSPTR